jgi:dinuclear metal center YbgI/SA1388 family protein
MQIAPLSEVTKFLDEVLNTPSFNDASCNGLQVDSGEQQIRTVAVAVDSGLSVINEAIKAKAELLIVHHGLYWSPGNHLASGLLGEKLRTLISGGCSLYASHLPLDGHITHGNAAQLAEHLGLASCSPFFHYHGSAIGVKAETDSPITLSEIAHKAADLAGVLTPPIALPFGKDVISSIGIVTGSGASAIETAKNAGLDLLISGEGKQEAYHTAKDLGMNVLFLGHYATETLGVRALGKLLESSYSMSSVFIDIPTGF